VSDSGNEDHVRDHQRQQDFADFVTAAWPRLRRAAFLLTHHHQDAEDLLQSVLAKAYVAWPRVRRDGAYSYVSRALVHGYVDHRRKHDRVRVVEDVDPGRVDPDLRAEDRSDLVLLLAPLSARERAVVVMRYYLDRPEAEVAAELGITTGTVKSTASRALARVRQDALALTPTEGAPDGR
jgi:RNA polymerase sigma-70 factor (sigma-E family)